MIYPLIAHWIFGGGFLREIGGGVQDFAGSTVVHLIGATGALAALLLLGPRKGKYGPDGKPRAIPGHSMPLVRPRRADPVARLVRLQRRLDARHGRRRASPRSSLVTQPRRGGRRHRRLPDRRYFKTSTLDVGMAGNGAIAGLVGITAPVGLRGVLGGPDHRPRRPASSSSTASWRSSKKLDDPVGALSAHGLAGVWGTLACGLFTSDRASPSSTASAARACSTAGASSSSACRRSASALRSSRCSCSRSSRSAVIKATVGLRVDEEDEEAGLDIAEHGMYGYPEQFIPAAGARAAYEPTVVGTPIAPVHAAERRAASSASRSEGA